MYDNELVNKDNYTKKNQMKQFGRRLNEIERKTTNV